MNLNTQCRQHARSAAALCTLNLSRATHRLHQLLPELRERGVERAASASSGSGGGRGLTLLQQPSTTTTVCCQQSARPHSRCGREFSPCYQLCDSALGRRFAGLLCHHLNCGLNLPDRLGCLGLRLSLCTPDGKKLVSTTDLPQFLARSNRKYNCTNL